MCYIASNMQIILDTSTVVAGVRSPNGASAEILRRLIKKKLIAVCSVPLFLEYEAVLMRPEHLQAANLHPADIQNLLDVLAASMRPVEIQFLWRPLLRDANDDMVLEAAVNGQASAIVTFNRKDFLPHALRFQLEVLTPSDYLKGL
jgi:putative PIN family toxin of toxin-antitoxin system